MKRSCFHMVMAVGAFVVGVVAIGFIPPLTERGPFDVIRPDPGAAGGAPLNAASTDSFVVLIGAGDIANCDSPGDELTAGIVDSLLQNTTAATWIVTMGDNANPRGTKRDFSRCYDPTWGQFRHITRPVTGNHDWKNGQWFWFLPFLGNADPYFAYFSSFPNQAGPPAEGSYRYRHGMWDVYALSTYPERYVVEGGWVWDWLVEQLNRPDHAPCAIAYYHYPRFSIGKHGDDDRLTALWGLMHEYGIDVFLTGHDQNYQRYAPQNGAGVPDPAGIRQFVVGTGGDELRPHYRETEGALERWTTKYFGVLRLELYDDSYSWEFVTSDREVWDTGSDRCRVSGQ